MGEGEEYICYFPCYCDKCLRKHLSEGRINFGSQFEDTVHHGEKAWWEELEEAAVHNFSVVKKFRKMNSGTQFPLPFHSF